MSESVALNAAALASLHNHPNGAGTPSAQDQSTSKLLKTRLERDGKLLFSDEIVPARAEPLREAAPRMKTLWDLRCEAEHALWRPYGGRRP